MDTIIAIVTVFLLLNIAAGLVRVFLGPTPADRLLSIQLFGTTGTAILCLLAVVDGNRDYLNIALVFALLAAILGVVFTRYWQEDDEETPQSLEDLGRELD